MSVEVSSLAHRYGARTALDQISFEVAPGEVFGVLGPNGSGKSTLFRILSTLLPPTGGAARVAGFDVARQPRDVLRRTGVVFQAHSLDRKLTVEENLIAQGRLFALSGQELRRRARQTMERLGLTDRRTDLTGQLSGGLQRRVEIAKALLHDPAVLLLDEPSTGLDPRARRELWRYLDDLRRARPLTVLLTTHLMDEGDRCDRVLLLHQGQKVAEGEPAELRAAVGGDVVIFECEDADRLRSELASRYGLEPLIAAGTVRVEVANGHRFAAEAVEAFPGLIRGVTSHKPTLEDVFVERTGASLSQDTAVLA